MLKKLKIQAEDTFRYNPVVRNLLASSILLRTPGAPAASTAEASRRIHKLCQAARLASTESMVYIRSKCHGLSFFPTSISLAFKKQSF
jgi:hypothetical protein